ncbi:MAG: hypothetical protein HC880_18275 [Bacteroidia bacterium]|nr:hypothetical protein [Bacteroidia bacterium]
MCSPLSRGVLAYFGWALAWFGVCAKPTAPTLLCGGEAEASSSLNF